MLLFFIFDKIEEGFFYKNNYVSSEGNEVE